MKAKFSDKKNIEKNLSPEDTYKKTLFLAKEK